MRTLIFGIALWLCLTAAAGAADKAGAGKGGGGAVGKTGGGSTAGKAAHPARTNSAKANPPANTRTSGPAMPPKASGPKPAPVHPPAQVQPKRTLPQPQPKTAQPQAKLKGAGIGSKAPPVLGKSTAGTNNGNRSRPTTVTPRALTPPPLGLRLIAGGGISRLPPRPIPRPQPGRVFRPTIPPVGPPRPFKQDPLAPPNRAAADRLQKLQDQADVLGRLQDLLNRKKDVPTAGVRAATGTEMRLVEDLGPHPALPDMRRIVVRDAQGRLRVILVPTE